MAYHRAVAERLRQDARSLEGARRRVREWSALASVPRHAREWQRILSGDLASIIAFLTERSELADELRQSSPFAGVLPPRERWRIWREVRDALVEAP